jgi:redox-sensitive bicupin YhaK (pirin superfamily)
MRLPEIDAEGVSGRVVIGAFAGLRSPVVTASDTLYADLSLAPGASLKIPAYAEERAIYTLEGEVSISGDRFPAERLLVFRPGDEIVVSSEGGAHFMLFGGASLGSKRYIWWNFVSSSKERIEQAKEEWKTGRFDIVPGDEEEFIPLPDN